MGHFLKRGINMVVWILALISVIFISFFVQRAHLFSWIDLKNFGALLKGALTLYVVVIGFFIFYENRNPHRTIAWLLVLFAFPIMGFVMYLAFGRSFRKRKISEAKRMFIKSTLDRRADVQMAMVPIVETFNASLVNERLVNLLLNNSKSPFFLQNDVTIYPDGTGFFEALLQDIRRARRSIHMEYYIVRADGIGNAIKDALIERAQNGVEVRIIYDSVGCWRLPKAYLSELKAAGVAAYAFLPMALPLFGRELNYRNHRKLTIVDGCIGYIGGNNIGDEYRGMSPTMGYWRDTHLRIVGEGVMGLQHHFLMDWAFVSHELLVEEDYLAIQPVATQALIQIAASGPDTDWEIIAQAYFSMIATAKSRIWIQTPYLVPDESIMMALETAALSGVDVRIIIPAKPDHLLVFWASRANLERLLLAGVKIYRYQKGFIHSKTMIVDESVASVGTANLDFRSLEINFEINAFLYGKSEILKLSDDFVRDIEVSEQVSLEDHAKRPKIQRVFEALGRLVSPLQ